MLPRGSGTTECRDRPGSQVRIQRKAGWKRKVGRWRTEASGCCGTLHSVSGRQPKRWASQSTGRRTGGATHAGSCGSTRWVAGGSGTAVTLYTFSHTLFRRLPGCVLTAVSTSTTAVDIWVAEGLSTRQRPFRQGWVASVGFRQPRGASSNGRKKRKWQR